MFKYLVSLYGWGEESVCLSETEINNNPEVIVESEIGKILGKVKRVSEEDEEYGRYNRMNIVRIATKKDMIVFRNNSEKRKSILKKCRKEAKKLGLDMKFVDICITLGKGTIVVSFISDGRIDFRQLVKNLSGTFHCSIKMHQIGSRDEARKLGGCGVCGKELCCSKFLGNIPSISTEMAKIQQVAQRGSDRISGVCGRLLCCLSYEADQYREMMKGMPEIGSKVKTEKGQGEIVEINPLKREIKVKIDNLNNEYIIIKKEEI